MKDIQLEEMLKAGLHFGHRNSKRHPKMVPFIFDTRSNIDILDLEKTRDHLEKARNFLKDLASEGRSILFVGTKRQAKEIMRKAAKSCGMPYAVDRWIGGLFTNFRVVSQLTKRLGDLREQKEKGELEKYTKKEQLGFDEEIKKLENMVGGLMSLTKLPDAIFLIGMKEDKAAVREAKKMKIPLIALLDTNNNPEDTLYPIPGNDDALKSVEYVASIISEAISEGVALKPKKEEDVKK